MSVPQAVCPKCGRVSKALAHCKYCDEFVPITLALTLTGYLGKVSEYWAGARAENDTACKRCEHYDGPGYCGMLHDGSVPDGDCLGLLERDGAHQPSEPSGDGGSPAK